MARKKEVKRVPVTQQEEKTTRSVRLDMSIEDHMRLERCAKKLGLHKASFARLAVMEKIRAVEGQG